MPAHRAKNATAGLAGLLAFALAAAPILAQQQMTGPPIFDQSQGIQGNAGPVDRMLLQKQRKALNHLRQKLLVADTNKLLELAQQLDAAAAPNGKPMSSSERVRKLAEIQKLAKRVRERMSYPLWSSSSPLMSPASSMIP